MRSALIAGSSQRKRVVTSSGEVTFDSVSTPTIQVEGSSISTPSWTINSGSNGYLLAFSSSAAYEAIASPTPVSHSGSGGTELTALIADFLPPSHAYTSGRAFGLAAPPTGAGTTYGAGTALWKGIASISFHGVGGIGEVITNSIAEEAASTTVSVVLNTPNTTDVCVAFGWVSALTTGSRMVSSSGMIDRGSAFDTTETYAIAMCQRARTGATTTLSFDLTGSTFYYAGIIGVVLEAAA